MRNDQIFVLLLVVLLPLSGCFDAGGIGEAEGAEESSPTVVNNYYNNTTISNSSSEIEYKYLVFDTELENGQWPTTIDPNNASTVHVMLGTFNTTGGNLYSVIYSAPTCETTSGWTSVAECYVAIKSTCGDIIYANQYFGAGASETTSFMLKGPIGNNCLHEVYSYYSTSTLFEINTIRLHYELGLKEISATPF